MGQGAVQAWLSSGTSTACHTCPFASCSLPSVYLPASEGPGIMPGLLALPSSQLHGAHL